MAAVLLVGIVEIMVLQWKLYNWVLVIYMYVNICMYVCMCIYLCIDDF